MNKKPLEIPPAAALEFVADMRAFFEAKGQRDADEIAANAGWKLKQHLPKGTKLRLSDVKEMFLQMRDQDAAATAKPRRHR